MFSSDGLQFALPLGRVREILLPRPFTRLPGCGAEVCGLVGYRGRAVTVFDLGAVLGRSRAAEADDHRLLLVEYGDRLVGGAVESVVRVSAEPVRRLPKRSKYLRGVKLDRECMRGIGARRDRSFVALDAEAILERLLA